MRRIITVLAVGALMAVMLVAQAAPAFAANPNVRACHEAYEPYLGQGDVTHKSIAQSCRPHKL